MIDLWNFLYKLEFKFNPPAFKIFYTIGEDLKVKK